MCKGDFSLRKLERSRQPEVQRLIHVLINMSEVGSQSRKSRGDTNAKDAGKTKVTNGNCQV